VLLAKHHGPNETAAPDHSQFGVHRQPGQAPVAVATAKSKPSSLKSPLLASSCCESLHHLGKGGDFWACCAVQRIGL
jgi:hypothetical protein